MKGYINFMNDNFNRAILLVTSGTASLDVFYRTIKSLEDKIKKNYPDYKIFNAFTSDRIIEMIWEKDSFKIHSVETALNSLYEDDYKEVYIQSLHLIPGSEFEKLKDIVKKFAYLNSFDKLILGSPLLYKDDNSIEDDYGKTIKALSKMFSKISRNEAVIFLGHGGLDDSYNRFYDKFQIRLENSGFDNVHLVTTKNYLDLDRFYDNLKVNNIDKIYLVPFMFFAGGHVKKYMVGDTNNSLKNILLNKGFEVEVYMYGFGEDDNIQDIFLEHLKECF